LAAGVLGAASGVFLALVPASVPPDRFSYPLGTDAFIAIQVWFFVQHLGLLAGQLGLWKTGALGSSRMALSGHLAGVVGMLLLAVTELVAIGAAESLYPSPRTDILDALYGASCVAIGLGLLAAGVAAIRAGVWRDSRRFLPALLGAYVFVPMFPAMLAGFIPARLGIAGWMLAFGLLGWVLLHEGRQARE
jgi:hypothetical protein